MESVIKKALELTFEPVAMILTDEKPPGARQFGGGKWGCVMFMLAAAAKGKTAAFDKKTFGCPGGGVGLGFGNQYRNFIGGEEGFCRFLSVGNQDHPETMVLVEKAKPYLRPEAYDNFVHGERYLKSPGRVRKFLAALPMIDLPVKYVVMKPLSEVDEAKERPEVVVFLADVDQAAALTVLANYSGEGNENVIIPYAAGCMSIGIYPYREAKSDHPRAVLGGVDISARVYLKRQLGADLLTFAAPFAMFKQMETDAPGSFLERHSWKELRELGQEKT